MPTERELSERFGVSRGTVRQALDRLEAEQRVHRHQGRGTFVAKPKMDHLLELTSHSEHIRSRGMEPASRLIGVGRVPAAADIAGMLALAEGDEILQIERVRLADGEPVAVEVLYLDARRFDDVAALLGESQSLYQLLRARYGVELAWAEETIEAVVAPEREASLLGIASGGPALLLCRQSFDPIGRPIEFVRSHIPRRPFPVPYPSAAAGTNGGRASPANPAAPGDNGRRSRSRPSFCHRMAGWVPRDRGPNRPGCSRRGGSG